MSTHKTSSANTLTNYFDKKIKISDDKSIGKETSSSSSIPTVITPITQQKTLKMILVVV